VTFAEDESRNMLAAAIRAHKIDVVIVGPVTRSGMNEKGTLQEVRDFMALVAKVRELSGRRVAFILVHHENKGGQVSGAWEASGDTLFHVTGQGHGRMRLYVQKARWSSAHHATALQLQWTDGEGFAVEDKPELDDETIAGPILAAIDADPGIGATKLDDAIKGVGNDRKRAVRDDLLRAGRIINVVARDGVDVALDHCPERSKARLHLAQDPAVSHLRQGSGADPAQTAPLWAEGDGPASAPCATPIRRTGVGAEPTALDNDQAGTP
jgi:hypothetical protein